MNIIVFTRKYTYNLLTCQVIVIKSVVCLLFLRASIGVFHIALAKEQKLRIKQNIAKTVKPPILLLPFDTETLFVLSHQSHK